MPTVTHDWTITIGAAGQIYGIREYHYPDLSNHVATGTIILPSGISGTVTEDWYSTALQLPGRTIRLPHRFQTVIVCLFLLVALSIGIVVMSIIRWRHTADEATKPVEPTGISSSSSDLITSHTSGESPGGSLRR